MDDFKNSTKTHYAMGGGVHAKGGSVKGAAKVAKVMGEFKKGALHKGNGGPVARGNRMQAEEAGESRLVRRAPPRKTAMTAEERAMAETIARGNRMQAEEAGESRLMRPRLSRKTGGLAVMPKGKKC